LIAACIVAFGAGGSARAQDAPAGDAANGQRIYLADGCFTCHGRSGQGDVLIAGQAKARNLTLVTHNTDEFGRVPGLRCDDWQT